MDIIILTQDNGIIIGTVAKLLGLIMNALFNLIDMIGIPNIGLAIILFTIVVNLLMLPITLKQQKFSKLSIKIQPEVQAIQNKYKNKKDQDSQMAMNQEIQMVYAKYGISPTGSCLYMLIQMPILFALYRVIYAMPAYVTKIGNTFKVLADKIISTDAAEFLKNSGITSIDKTVSMYAKNMDNNLTNGVIDVLNRLSSHDMNVVSEHYGLADLTYPVVNGDLILSSETTEGLIDIFNNFLGLNIGNSPQVIISYAMKAGAWGLVIGAILIPVLSAVTQWINAKLIPQQPKSGNEQADSMAQSMRAMNYFMPIMSAFICFTLPAGMGLYWVAGSIVRSIQQVAINKHIDKMDFDDIIKKNQVKSAKKLEQMKLQQERMNAYANMNTKNINNTMKNKASVSTGVSQKEMNDAMESGNTYNHNAKPGSMLAKANMVRDYNEKKNK